MVRAWAFASLCALAAADLRLRVYNSTTTAGAILAEQRVSNVALPDLPLGAGETLVFSGELAAAPGTWYTYAVKADHAYTRLWIDDHLMIDGDAQPEPEPVQGDYVLWKRNIDTPGHSMQDVGGDCAAAECGSVEKCIARCESLRSKGCIGFTMGKSLSGACYMRKLGSGEACAAALEDSDQYVTVTNGGCDATGDVLSARYPLPVGFFPGANTSRLRLEVTTVRGQRPSALQLLVNGSAVADGDLRPTLADAEARYFKERKEAEVGWNTWLSEDMLTHALLPHGLGLSLSFHAGSESLSGLGAQGPKCSRKDFPATHGLHATRGAYTEIQSLDFAGASYRVESATVDGDLLLLVTTLSSGEASELSLDAAVPSAWKPRVCGVELDAEILRAECPGLEPVVVHSLQRPSANGSSARGFSVKLPQELGQAVAFSTGSKIRTLPEVQTSIARARAKLLQEIETFGKHNETFAGMKTAISWLVVYSPLEGIFTPVFRGSPWAVSKPHNYVLFEWDTYFAAMIATHVDPWVAKSNIIRMTKSLIYKGFVAGFWNGLCGETDKSKPPVGTLALQYLVAQSQDNLWVAELLMDQLVLWNRWWSAARLKSGLLAPGSTRSMLADPTACTDQSPLVAARCETGLDNSPLYTGAGYEAKFVDSEDVMDSVDVGMTALYAQDTAALLALATSSGRQEFVQELRERSKALAKAVDTKMWNEEEGIYHNRLWQADDWIPLGKSGAIIVAPTNFYPMMASIPSDDQVDRMMSRWLTNTSEFCVSDACEFALPSISRSCSAFHDNSYWRGRNWGPMTFLVYLGLKKYEHLSAVADALKSMSAQAERTFLVEWTKEHRVMENFNSEKGVGCDVGNAIPFYHWGALNALVPLLESGLLSKHPTLV